MSMVSAEHIDESKRIPGAVDIAIDWTARVDKSSGQTEWIQRFLNSVTSVRSV